MKQLISTFKNSDFFLRSRKRRADDCEDTGDSATQKTKTENLSHRALWVLQRVNEGVSSELTLTTSWMKTIVRRSMPNSRSGKKCIFRGALITLGLCFYVVTTINVALARSSDIVRQPHIQVSLISSVDQVKLGEPFQLGVKFEPDLHWHVYWLNPGDSGVPPAIEWTMDKGTMDKGVTISDIQWPFPQQIPVGPLMNFGFHESVVLPVNITTLGNSELPALTFQANASWLVCKEECIPGNAKLALTLPVAGAVTASKQAKQLDVFRKKVPKNLQLLSAQIVDNGNTLSIDLYATQPIFRSAKKIELFPITENLVEYSQQPEMRWKHNRLTANIEKSATFQSLPAVVEGVVVIDRTQAWLFKFHVNGQ